MEKKRYPRLMGIIALLLAVFALASAITSVALYYIEPTKVLQFINNPESVLKLVFMPLLIVSSVITLISGILSTLNLASVYGKISFAMDVISVALLIATYVKLGVG